MPLDSSRDQLYKILQNTARHVLGAKDSKTRQKLLERIAEEHWRVAQVPIQLEDEPGFLL